jgi:hypothetical protein
MTTVVKCFVIYYLYIHILTCYYCGIEESQDSENNFIIYLTYLKWSLNATVIIISNIYQSPF